MFIITLEIRAPKPAIAIPHPTTGTTEQPTKLAAEVVNPATPDVIATPLVTLFAIYKSFNVCLTSFTFIY